MPTVQLVTEAHNLWANLSDRAQAEHVMRPQRLSCPCPRCAQGLVRGHRLQHAADRAYTRWQRRMGYVLELRLSTGHLARRLGAELSVYPDPPELRAWASTDELAHAASVLFGRVVERVTELGEGSDYDGETIYSIAD